MALDLPEGVSIEGAVLPGFEKVLTREALAFVADPAPSELLQPDRSSVAHSAAVARVRGFIGQR